MIKRGRPKGATAYPEHAVCIKCQVFRPKRRGYCDRCRPRNRGAAAKTAANPTTTSPSAAAITSSTPPPPPSSSSSVGLSKLVPSEHQKHSPDSDAMVIQHSPAPAVAGQSAGDDRPAAMASSVEAGSRGVKRQRHSAAHGSQNAAAQIRGKRRRTVSAPVSANHHNNHNSGSTSTNGRLATSLMMVSSAMQAFERNRNVDVVSAYAAAAGATAKDRKPDASPYYPTGTGSAAHQLALLLPRSDGTAVDVVPLQFLSTTSPTATVASPSPALTSSGAASPTSSPSVTSAHSLMSLANVSALAAARYPSPSSHSSSWSSSPPSSPHRPLLHSSSSPYSSPPSSSSSSLSFALPQPRASACGGGGSSSHSYSSRAGDLVLPSLGSLALPRPALPLHFFPSQASAGLHLASMVAPAAPLRLAPN